METGDGERKKRKKMSRETGKKDGSKGRKKGAIGILI